MSLANSRRALEKDLLNMLNDVNKLTVSGLTAAKIIPKIPEDKEIRVISSEKVTRRTQQNLEDFFKRVVE